MKTTIRVHNMELSFSDDDVVEPTEFIPDGEYNPHNIHPWLLHDHGFPVAVVFASNLQDALDAAADADKLDRYLIAEEEHAEYGIDTDEPTCSFLGNDYKPYDIDTLGYVKLRNPPFSFCALFYAQEADKIAIGYFL